MHRKLIAFGLILGMILSALAGCQVPGQAPTVVVEPTSLPAETAQTVPTTGANATVAATEAATATELATATTELVPTEAATVAEAATTAATTAAQTGTTPELVLAGQPLYTTYCSGCHQPNGEGLDGPYPYPALNGDRVANDANPDAAIKQVLNARGRIMPPFRDTLTDDQIAAILSYVRNAWSNHASLVQPEDVARVRAQ